MEHLGLPFEVVMPEGVDEEAVVGDSSYQIAQEIALAKAKSVAEKFPDAIVIAADTLVVFGEQILGSPRIERMPSTCCVHYRASGTTSSPG